MCDQARSRLIFFNAPFLQLSRLAFQVRSIFPEGQIREHTIW